MALPPADLASYIELYRRSWRGLPAPGSASALAACLQGWQDHRHFVAPDADRFAQHFSTAFDCHVRAHLGSTSAHHWGEAIDLAAADADAARRLFFELFDGFREACLPADVEAAVSVMTAAEEGGPGLAELLVQWRDEPASRPGDGSVAACRNHLLTWLRQRGERSQPSPFEACFVRHFDDWLRHHARRGNGSWAQQLARIAPEEAPFAALLRLALSLRQRLHDVADRHHPAYGDTVVPD